MTAQPETRVVTAKILDVYDANQHGFYDIKVESADGPMKLSTKRSEIAQSARGGKGGTWQLTVKTRYNEKDGTTYANHYLEKVDGIPGVDAAGPDPQAVEKAPVDTGYMREKRPEESLRIMRMHAMTDAIAHARTAETWSFEQLVALAERFLDYYQNGPVDDNDVPF
jgi:hypothetical protein